MPDAWTRSLLECRDCPRLASYLDDIRSRWPDYHARPVPAFGEHCARLLIVGLAPGLHGANRTGRPFTGDYAGELLYRTLLSFGLAHGHVLMVLPNQGNIAQYRKIRDQGGIRGDEAYPRLVSPDELLQHALQFPVPIEER